MKIQEKARLIGLGLLLLAAGCSPSGTAGTSGGPPPGTDPAITTSFVEDSLGPAVGAVVIGRSSLTAAELVSPSGNITPASAIDREVMQGGYGYPPSVGVGVFGGSGGGFGLGSVLGIPLGGGGGPPTAGPNRARARLPIANLADYRQRWQSYVVRLRFTSAAGETVVADIPAPAPKTP